LEYLVKFYLWFEKIEMSASILLWELVYIGDCSSKDVFSKRTDEFYFVSLCFISKEKPSFYEDAELSCCYNN